MGGAPDGGGPQGGRRAVPQRAPPQARPVGQVVEPPGRGPYLLTGTVTLDALAAAATQLPASDGDP